MQQGGALHQNQLRRVSPSSCFLRVQLEFPAHTIRLTNKCQLKSPHERVVSQSLTESSYLASPPTPPPSLQLGCLPVPWLPWIPVHPGERQTPRRVQMLQRVQHPGSHQPGAVHSQDPALSLKTKKLSPPQTWTDRCHRSVDGQMLSIALWLCMYGNLSTCFHSHALEIGNKGFSSTLETVCLHSFPFITTMRKTHRHLLLI